MSSTITTNKISSLVILIWRGLQCAGTGIFPGWIAQNSALSIRPSSTPQRPSAAPRHTGISRRSGIRFRGHALRGRNQCSRGCSTQPALARCERSQVRDLAPLWPTKSTHTPTRPKAGCRKLVARTMSSCRERLGAPCGNHEPNFRPRLPYSFFPNTFFNHAAAARKPTMTSFFAASSATSNPLKSPAFAASPPATSAASPYVATLSVEALKSV